jgi:hypothetical protein
MDGAGLAGVFGKEEVGSQSGSGKDRGGNADDGQGDKKSFV